MFRGRSSAHAWKIAVLDNRPTGAAVVPCLLGLDHHPGSLCLGRGLAEARPERNHQRSCEFEDHRESSALKPRILPSL